jgi:hypothetical protein
MVEICYQEVLAELLGTLPEIQPRYEQGRVATLGPARRADPILGLRVGLEAIPNGDIGAKQRLAPTHIFEFLERMASSQDPAARVIWGPAVARQSPL